MDRSIIEILNTNGLIVFSIIFIILFQNIYYIVKFGNDELEFKYLVNYINNFLEEIYLNSKEYGYQQCYYLLLSKPVHLKANGYALNIILDNFEASIVTRTKIVGEASSDKFSFWYINETIYFSTSDCFITSLYTPYLVG